MKKKKDNEELQSRREFFKKAAKGVLPFLGIAALASAPQIVNAAETIAMGCNGTCKMACANSCATNCRNRCESSCQGGCKGSCKGSSYRIDY